MENFKTRMAELLEVDSVNDADVLEEFEAWDSLTSLSIIAFIDEEYSMGLSAKDLLLAKTVGGLEALVATGKKPDAAQKNK